VPPPRLQLQSAVQASRFIDCQVAFTDAHCRLLLRMLRVNKPEDRRKWFVDTSGCRRRPQAKIEQLRGTGLPTVCSLWEEEYPLLPSV
jgi:hypothetical protein